MFFLQSLHWDLLPACFGRDNGCGKRGYLTVRDQTVRFMPSNSLLKTCQTLAKLQSSKNCVLSMLHVILLESSTIIFWMLHWNRREPWPQTPPPCPSPDCVCILPTDELSIIPVTKGSIGQFRTSHAISGPGPQELLWHQTESWVILPVVPSIPVDSAHAVHLRKLVSLETSQRAWGNKKEMEKQSRLQETDAT